MNQIRGWAALAPNQKLEPFSYDAGPIGPEEVEITVESCGLCHGDLSIIRNEWGFSTFPVIPGHEVVGKITAMGEEVRGLAIGQRVGVGWNSHSCLHCYECLSGHQNLCAEAMPTIVGHQGGFADRIRAHWVWTIPLPDTIDSSVAGPLLCAGIAVFDPLYSFDIKPTAHVGIVGVGGLGHLGLQFARAWGCEVTAFTTNESKTRQAMEFGAHHVVTGYGSEALEKAANSLDLIIVTIDSPLEWAGLLKTLKPNGRLHMLGTVLQPMPIPAMELIFGQKNVSGSPTGGPAAISKMLEFAARHRIMPRTEYFPMSQVNEALAHLESGNARYRIVLTGDAA